MCADWTPFGISQLKRRLHRRVWVYNCQNATLLEFTCCGSIIYPFIKQYKSRSADFLGPSDQESHCFSLWLLNHVNSGNTASQLDKTWPRGHKTWVHSQTQNKAQWLVACGHVSASNQSLRFILSLWMNSSFITSRPGVGLVHKIFSMLAVKETARLW